MSKTKFEIITITGDRLGAGTDANVFCTIYGSRGQTEKLALQRMVKISKVEPIIKSL